jgi:hypothetical protein
LGVHRVDVADADVEEAADAIRVARRPEDHFGLSSVGPPPTLMMIQLVASATIVGSADQTVSLPSSSG